MVDPVGDVPKHGPRWWSAPLRWTAVLVWTLTLGVGLFLLDRRWVPIPKTPEWVVTADFASVPLEVRDLVIPTDLPSALAWPPHRILYRTQGHRGIWVGLTDAAGSRFMVWYGLREGELPRELGALRGCLADERTRCPGGWHVLTQSLDEKTELVLISRLRPREDTQLLDILSARLRREP